MTMFRASKLRTAKVTIFLVSSTLIFLMMHYSYSNENTKAQIQGKLEAGGDRNSEKIDFDKISLDQQLYSTFYIKSKKPYNHRLKPNYYVDEPLSRWQADSYWVAAEIARRFGCKYIIDIGCGKASKTAMLSKEFQVIGVDYKVNLIEARKKYPRMTFIEANLDKSNSCEPLPISPNIMSEAVVLSADVLEHIIDPFFCYLRILKYMAKFSPAVVVSTPDRSRIGYQLSSFRMNGPPHNVAHVREWIITELEYMFKDIGMPPIISSWICVKFNDCTNGYRPGKTHFSNSLLVNIHSMGPNNLKPEILVTAFVIVYPYTNTDLANANIASLTNQNIHVILLTLPEAPQLKGEVLIKVKNMEEVKQYVKEVLNKPEYKEDDWFIIQGAHDTINITWLDTEGVNVRTILNKVSTHPGNFNAMALTTLYLHSQEGHIYSNEIPFKLDGPGPWDDGKLSRFMPLVNTLQNRVRIWKKTKLHNTIHFVTNLTRVGHEKIIDVEFSGRKVFPFHLVDVCSHPNQPPVHHIALTGDWKRMYGLALAIGYMPKARSRCLETKPLY